MHRTDALGPTASCEVLLEGSAFWRPDNDLEIVHTPGHTAGSISVLFRTGKDTVLFTGDHLAYTESRQALDGFRQYNHGNEFMQAVSIRLLADDSYSFTCTFICFYYIL